MICLYYKSTDRLTKDKGEREMTGLYTVVAKIVEAKEETPEVTIKLIFASKKVAIDVRSQFVEDGYTASAQLIKELG